MNARRFLLLVALLATGLSSRVVSGDSSAPQRWLGVGEPSVPVPGHFVTLEEGVPENLITVLDFPGSLVRVWMRLPNGSMTFAGMTVIGPDGFGSVSVPQAAFIPGLPRYLVVTTRPENDIRDWLE